MNIGRVIKSIRKSRGVKQKNLSKKVDISQSYLSQIESNKKIPSLPLLIEIGNALQIPVYYFFLKGEEVNRDIPNEKVEAYKMLKPAIESMIESFFINEIKLSW